MKHKNYARQCIASLAAAGLWLAASAGVQAVPSEPYDWQNVRIDGGGFVPGIVFNRTEPGLIYARTDIGGVYRWQPESQTWKPLLDWVGWDNWGWNGVLSVATDPVDPDRVYAAVGMYTNGWDPNNGAILRSSDRGETWEATELPFHIGGNMPGRGMGERLAIDPNDNSTLYFGAEGGNGLWRSTDYGETWSEVTAFPNPGDYAQDPDDPNNYLNQIQGVVWVDFDRASGTPGQGSDRIFVGVADLEQSLYQSLDGGQTWEPIPGAPTGYIPHKAVVDHDNGRLYVATSDTGGPYDGALGEVWRYDIATGTWTDISPVAASSDDAYFGYSGLTLDRQNPETLIVASQISWWPDAIFYRSTDAGETWNPIWEWGAYPQRNMKYEIDISEVPWLDFGVENPVAPETAPKLGWMNESVEIDPHNSDRLMYGTGATIYGTENLTAWDNGGTIVIRPMVEGLEETAILDLASPPEGAHLFSTMLDVGGFKHTDLDQVPESMFTTPTVSGNTSIDFAALSPSTMVRVGEGDGEAAIGITTSAGDSWWAGQLPSGATGGGTVAMAADGGSIVWSTEGAGVQYSTTFGSSWTASTGVPDGALVKSDRVNPSVFYALSEGRLYVSTNQGATFSQTAASNLPTTGTQKFEAVPGFEGHLWFAGGSTDGAYGLWRSTDGGETFTRISNVEEANNVGFGKAAPGADYPALYIIAQVDGVRGVFRSTDEGNSWVRINDDQHQYGNFGDAITGDPRIYGRFYLGTNGRGIIYGDPAGGVSSSSAASSVSSSQGSSVSSEQSSSVSSSVSSSMSSSVSSSVSSAVSSSLSSSVSSSMSSSVSSVSSSSASSAPVGDLACAVNVVNDWGSGYQLEVSVSNNGSSATSGWSVVLSYANTPQLSGHWSAELTTSGNEVTATNLSWNGQIQPGQSTAFGVLGDYEGSFTAPTCSAVN